MSEMTEVKAPEEPIPEFFDCTLEKLKVGDMLHVKGPAGCEYLAKIVEFIKKDGVWCAGCNSSKGHPVFLSDFSRVLLAHPSIDPYKPIDI